MEVVLAALGAVLVSVGIGLWSIPAGVAVAGALCILGAYVVAYVKARSRR